jgi:hypothetical protein
MPSSTSYKVLSLFTIGLYLFSLFLYFAGIVHSFKRHSTRDFVVTILLPPWAVFRGGEMFWHSEHPNAWNPILQDDAKTIFAFLNADMHDPQTANSTKTEIQKFADKIASYPPDKIEYLKRAANQYIDFKLSMLKDFANMPPEFKGNSLIGYNTRKIADSISNMYGYKEINFTIRAMNSLTLAGVSEERNNNDAYTGDFSKKELLTYEQYKIRFAEVYRDFFSQALILSQD